MWSSLVLTNFLTHYIDKYYTTATSYFTVVRKAALVEMTIGTILLKAHSFQPLTWKFRTPNKKRGSCAISWNSNKVERIIVKPIMRGNICIYISFRHKTKQY